MLCASGAVGCARAQVRETPEPLLSSGDSAAAAPLPERDVPISPAAALLRGRALMVPVDGVAPSSVRDSYGASRGAGIHASIDIFAPRGTPVLAADDGRVFKLRNNPSGGITIYALDHEERIVYYYAHLDAYREGLAEGVPIAQGELLGYVGTTGNAPKDVPHLHFQVMRYRGNGQWWAGEPVDARPFLQKRGQLR